MAEIRRTGAKSAASEVEEKKPVEGRKTAPGDAPELMKIDRPVSKEEIAAGRAKFASSKIAADAIKDRVKAKMAEGRGAMAEADGSAPVQSEDEVLQAGALADKLGQDLAARAKDEKSFHAAMKDIYGANYDRTKVEALRQQALKGDLSWLPRNVEFRDRSELDGANGAYSPENGGTIYLARDLKDDPAKLEAVFNQEAGHHADALLQLPKKDFEKAIAGGDVPLADRKDARGDEGERLAGFLATGKVPQGAVAAEIDRGRVGGKEVEFDKPGATTAPAPRARAVLPTAADLKSDDPKVFGPAIEAAKRAYAADPAGTLKDLKAMLPADRLAKVTLAMAGTDENAIADLVSSGLKIEEEVVGTESPGRSGVSIPIKETRVDASGIKGTLDAAAKSKDPKVKARVFEEAAAALADLEKRGIDSDEARKAVEDIRAGMTKLLKSDANGVVDALEAKDRDGKALVSYVESMVGAGKKKELGEVMSQLIAGNDLKGDPFKRFEEMTPGSTGKPFYQNAENLGYFLGAVEAGIQNVTTGAKNAAAAQAAILKDIYGVVSSLVPLPGPAGDAASAIFGRAVDALSNANDVEKRNTEMRKALRALAFPRDEAGNPYDGDAEATFDSARERVTGAPQ